MDNKRQKIYVVMGSTGEYSDNREWPVFAFEDEADARAYVELCTARANELKQWQEQNKTSYDYVPDEFKNYDKKLEPDYNGMNYYIENVEMYEDNVTRFAKGRYKKPKEE